MRILLVALCLFVIPAAPANAAGMACTVSVPTATELNAGATWSFEVTGAQPNTPYKVKVNWPGDPSNGSHTNADITTDATGHGVTVLARWWSVDGFLPGGWPNGYDQSDPLSSFVAVPGAFSVQVGPGTFNGDRAGKANCSAEVLP